MNENRSTAGGRLMGKREKNASHFVLNASRTFNQESNLQARLPRLRKVIVKGGSR